jgi:hypothetical protein
MKALFNLRSLAFMVFALFISSMAMAQDAPKSAIPSPPDSVSAKVAGANVKIKYSSPSVKGRKIFGGKEPWGKVYRAGANDATTFTTDKDIMVEGQPLPAGTYAFFVIPMETGPWTVIFNKTAKQWGAFNYDQSKDQLRVMVQPQKIDLQERMVYRITADGFSMNWENTSIPVKVK